VSHDHEESDQNTAPRDLMTRIETYERPVTRRLSRPHHTCRHSPDDETFGDNDPIFYGL